MRALLSGKCTHRNASAPSERGDEFWIWAPWNRREGTPGRATGS